MHKSKTQGVVERLNLNQVINSVKDGNLSSQDIDDVIGLKRRYERIELGPDNCFYCIVEAPTKAVLDCKLSLLKSALIQTVQDISRLKEQKGENMTQEFLKLNAAPNYYRFDLFALLTSGLGDGLGDDIDGFDTACQAVDEYLANKHNIKSLWGWGAAKYDKGTVFENNDGYYLFFKAPSPEQGERIEHEIISLFGSYELYHSTEDYE